jgi:hypothetical protein
MPITINGSGTVTGISVGGLPDGIVTAPELNGAQTGSAPIYGCRAWVNFDGTRNEADTGASTNGANVKIRASGNVTSVLKNGTGDYTVNFTTAMVDSNYCVVANIGNDAITPVDTVRTFASRSLTTSNFRLIGNRTDGTAQDQIICCTSIFR